MKDCSKKSLKKTVCLMLVFLMTGALFYLLNYHTPLYADDFVFIYSRYTGKKVGSLKDIFESLYSFYFSGNGRIVDHFFAQLFLFLGKRIFNFVNTFAFLTLGVLIFYHGTDRRLKENVSLLFFIYCALFVLTPAFGQSFLWLTGASNYLYGIELILFYLIPYRFIIKTKDERQEKSLYLTIAKGIGMLFLGLLAGWTNENTGIALIVMVFSYFIYYKMRKIKLKSWMICGWVGNIIGYALLLLSPGEWLRLDSTGKVSILYALKNIIYISFKLVEYLGPLLILFTVMVFLYIYPQMPIKSIRKFLCQELSTRFLMFMYMVGFFGATYSMIVAPYFPGRAWSGPLVLLIISFLLFYTNIIPEYARKFITYLQIILVTGIVVFCLPIYIIAVRDLREIDLQNKTRIEIIEKTIANNQDTAYIPVIKSDSKYSCFEKNGDLELNPEFWPNPDIAKYYGIAKIVGKDKEE